VTVFVSVPGQAEFWVVSNAAFRMLVEVVAELTDDTAIEDVMSSAVIHHGLALEELDRLLRDRVADVLARAAAQLRQRLLDQPCVDEWSRSFAAHLPVLEMWLDGIVDA
jgi:hypothetical protein